MHHFLPHAFGYLDHPVKQQKLTVTLSCLLDLIIKSLSLTYYATNSSVIFGATINSVPNIGQRSSSNDIEQEKEGSSQLIQLASFF